MDRAVSSSFRVHLLGDNCFSCKSSTTSTGLPCPSSHSTASVRQNPFESSGSASPTCHRVIRKLRVCLRVSSLSNGLCLSSVFKASSVSLKDSKASLISCLSSASYSSEFPSTLRLCLAARQQLLFSCLLFMWSKASSGTTTPSSPVGELFESLVDSLLFSSLIECSSSSTTPRSSSTPFDSINNKDTLDLRFDFSFNSASQRQWMQQFVESFEEFAFSFIRMLIHLHLQLLFDSIHVLVV